MARSTHEQRKLRGKQGAPGKAGPRGPRGTPGRSAVENITRAEFDKALESIHENIQVMQVQFRRMADMQAEVDQLKRIVARLSQNVGGAV